MSTEFDPWEYLFGDRAGESRWLIGHFRQHLAYWNALAAQSPSIIIADHPLLRRGESKLEKKIWVNDHAIVHSQLRVYTGISGDDYSQIDLDNPKVLDTFFEDHNQEHLLLDQALGLA